MADKINSPVTEYYGENVFNDAVMRRMLKKEVYESLKKTVDGGELLDPAVADEVASAMKEWAIEKGATHFTHWFQPLTGITAEKHEAFISPKPDGTVMMEFSAKELIKGEPDASSFPSGGLRNVFEARGYTAWDCSSPAFIKDNALCIPTVFFSHNGDSLDNKTPLLRSMEAVNRQSLRVLRLLGDKESSRVIASVGAEQEYFLVDRELYEKRLDLKICGRTLFGARAAKGQEMDDHYFGRLRIRVAEYMQELDRELWRFGVASKMRHNEAAPAQHELVPVYSSANVACDNNQIIMETMRRVAKKLGLACLLHEKPFSGVNGSGKHNNWSLCTDKGKNLLNPGKTPEENLSFLVFISAMIKAVDENADLLRFAAATPGNDARLGMAEAPPAIISMFLGDELTELLESVAEAKDFHSHSREKIKLGVSFLPSLPKETTDRNRTSPFAFTGNKFEFRMCSSSASIATPSFIMNAIAADALRQIADRLEAVAEEERTAEVQRIIHDVMRDHSRVIYNGNNYSEEWKKEAEKRGLPNLASSVEAYSALKNKKNIELLVNSGVLTLPEINARLETSYELYSKTVNVEAQIMIHMASRQILPAAYEYAKTLADEALSVKALGLPSDFASEDLEKLLSHISVARKVLSDLDSRLGSTAELTDDDRAFYFHDYVCPKLAILREACDEMERLMPEKEWPFPNYMDLMFGI